MKSLMSGLVAAIIVGAIGLIVLRSTGVLQLPSFFKSSPSPSASATPNFDIAPESSAYPTPSVSPSASPSPSASAKPSTGTTTKGGQVLGTTSKTTTKTTTRTISHVTYTLAKSSDCPTTITAELKDISAELSLQYRIHDDFSAAITVWNEKGEELASQKTYTGNGQIVSTGSAKAIKVLIQPTKCNDVDYTWLEVLASR